MCVGKAVQIWATPTMLKEFAPFRLLRAYGGMYDDATCVGWSACSRWVIVGSKDLTARVYSANHLENYTPPNLAGHREQLVHVAFGAGDDADTAYTVSKDGALFEWRLEDIIEEHEEQLLLSESEKSKAKWLKLAIILGIDCGLRRGEIIKLRRENINFLTSTALLIGTKNGSNRDVGLSPRVIAEMHKLPINIDGRVINCSSNDNFQHFYSQLQRWTGVKKSFHTTRHTFASRCAMNGWSIAEISAQGGWKNLSILKRYTHIKASYLSMKLGNC